MVFNSYCQIAFQKDLTNLPFYQLYTKIHFNSFDKKLGIASLLKYAFLWLLLILNFLICCPLVFSSFLLFAFLPFVIIFVSFDLLKSTPMSFLTDF